MYCTVNTSEKFLPKKIIFCLVNSQVLEAFCHMNIIFIIKTTIVSLHTVFLSCLWVEM